MIHYHLIYKDGIKTHYAIIQNRKEGIDRMVTISEYCNLYLIKFKYHHEKEYKFSKSLKGAKTWVKRHLTN